MGRFGETLFGGSRLVAWLLKPFVLLFAVLMPFLIESWTPIRVALVFGMDLMCLALLAGFWLPAKVGRWAFRGLAALVFLAYAGYVTHEFIFAEKAFSISGRRSDASPFNALLGFIFIGLPCLWYAVSGRMSLRAPVPEAEIDDTDFASDEHDPK